MTPETQLLDVAVPAGPRFVIPIDDADGPPARVVEYFRPARVAQTESDPWPSSARWPVAPHSRLPSWLRRLLVAWGLITLASLLGPCRPLSPSPALAAEASP